MGRLESQELRCMTPDTIGSHGRSPLALVGQESVRAKARLRIGGRQGGDSRGVTVPQAELPKSSRKKQGACRKVPTVGRG